MGKKSKANRKNGNNNKPQSLQSTPINLTNFQPFRRMILATQTDVTKLNPTKALSMNERSPPGNSLVACESFLIEFDQTRVVFVDVFFDQRGSDSTAGVPRATAFCANQTASLYDASKLSDIARFAGSGMNQVVPGKRFRINIGPRYTMGQFGGGNQSGTLFIVTKDYQGTVRIETCFEAYGPPLNYEVSLEEKMETNEIERMVEKKRPARSSSRAIM
jgi:hypothetical protein